MQLLKGMARPQKIAIGTGAGVVLNTVVHAAIRGGHIVNPVFDSQKAGIALAVEGSVAVLDGIFIDPWAGVISGLTALALFGVDYASSRTVTPAMPAAPAAPANLNTLVQNAEKSLVNQGAALLKKIF